MSSTLRTLGLGLLLSTALAACGAGGDGSEPSLAGQPLNTDYSTLKAVESRPAPLEYASSDAQILSPLRNGVRMLVRNNGAPGGVFTASPAATDQYSATTVQVDGVAEADAVRYDGRYLYTARSADPQSSSPPYVLAIARTDTTAATVQPVSTFTFDDKDSTSPQLYQLPASGGPAEYIVSITQNVVAWHTDFLPIVALVQKPDHTIVQVLDVRDPQNVSQAWKLQLDGWLSASRLIGDTLYLVSSYRPRIPGLVLPADTLDKQEANERLIRSSTADQLMPHYSENGGAQRPLVTSRGCLIPQQIASNESYTDLLVISAINVRTRQVSDVNCLSTNVNGVYMATNSLYIAGTGAGPDDSTITVLHKFAIQDGTISYHATGSVVGAVGWSNPSYFMDEHDGDLRILTSGQLVHRLSVLREAGRTLNAVSTLPNASRPEPIGKTGDSVYAVRFVGDRAYVVTFRLTDPLYVIDLHDPVNPAIAGQLEIPGVSSYLRSVGAYLLSVGQDVTPDGRRAGVKVEIFDVRDIAHPQSLGAQVFGKAGTYTEGLDNPHALTFLEKTGSLRLAMPLDVYETAWKYSGLHMLEVAGTDTASPQLHFQGVIKTGESGNTPYPPARYPKRAILHDDAVFAVHGDLYLSARWQDLPTR
jgi:uncharacterized secreted protein with C-terminal beta-propeller domain